MRTKKHVRDVSERRVKPVCQGAPNETERFGTERSVIVSSIHFSGCGSL